MKNTIAFTLCSNNYLAFAKTLGDSFLKHHPEATFVIGIVDKPDSTIDYTFFEPNKIIFAEEIKSINTDWMAENYNIIEFNTAVKPFYFNHFFKSDSTVERVIYLDPDIKCYQPFDELKDQIGSKSVCLTPHSTNPLSEGYIIEKRLLNYGLYNLGFCWLNKSETSNAVLDWWMERLSENCKQDLKNGVFVDQLWMNLIPIYFKDEVHISYDLGLNMAYWNFHERKISKIDDEWYVNKKYKLKFYHFSSYKVESPELIGKYAPYSFEQRPDVMPLYDDYKADLIKNNYLGLKDKVYKYNEGKPTGRSLIGRIRDFGYFVKLGIKASLK